MTRSAQEKQQLLKIELLLMDCDGVLTDGRLYFSEKGEAMKVFHVRDGQGLALWHAAGFRSGVISGRDSGDIIRARASELGIHFVRAGSRDKVRDLEEILAEAGLEANQAAFIGDDVGDVAAMARAGFAVAVADASDETKAAAAYVTMARGGEGAVREVIELLLAAKSEQTSA